MPDNQLYAQIRGQFNHIIEQDKRRRKRISRLLLSFHFLLVVGSAFYMWRRAYEASVGWYLMQTEIVWVLWGVIAFSWIVHAVTVLMLNGTGISDTVRESLMLMIAHQEVPASSRLVEKRKRNLPGGESEETDALFMVKDGDLALKGKQNR